MISSIVGRRLKASVETGSVTKAIEWARALQQKKIAEEFSIAPMSLEDVYVSMIGRSDAIEGPSLEITQNQQAEGA